MQSNPQRDPPNISNGVWIIIWLVILMLMIKFFDGQIEDLNHIEQYDQGPSTLVLKRATNGHYFARGYINQTPVTFLLDTGATNVAIPLAIANQIGLQRGYQHETITANGRSIAYQTRLDTLEIGNIQLFDVNASIVEGFQGEQILLGMSALKQLEFSQKGDLLTLKQL